MQRCGPPAIEITDLKQQSKKQLAENRADFDRVKRVFFYTTIEKF